MKQHWISIGLCLALSACAPSKPSVETPPDESAKTVSPPRTATHDKENRAILPGKSFGPVTATTTEADLQKRLGKAQVVSGPFYVGEGVCIPATIAYPDDPEKRFTVVWVDTDTRQAPRLVSIEGARSVWKAPHGITLGTTASQLEKANGKPFKFFGFGWDYGGTLSSWDGGALESDLKGVQLRLALQQTEEGTTIQDPNTYGDSEFSSSALGAAANMVTVERLSMTFLDNHLKNPDNGQSQVSCEELETLPSSN